MSQQLSSYSSDLNKEKDEEEEEEKKENSEQEEESKTQSQNNYPINTNQINKNYQKIKN